MKKRWIWTLVQEKYHVWILRWIKIVRPWVERSLPCWTIEHKNMILPTTSATESGHGSHVPSDCPVTLRNETTCPPYFPCVHGDCVTHAVNSSVDNGAVRFTCKCDVTWSGVHCDVCCGLDCANGTCVMDDVTPTCSCDWGYDGPFCNETSAFIPSTGQLESRSELLGFPLIIACK